MRDAVTFGRRQRAPPSRGMPVRFSNRLELLGKAPLDLDRYTRYVEVCSHLRHQLRDLAGLRHPRVERTAVQGPSTAHVLSRRLALEKRVFTSARGWDQRMDGEQQQGVRTEVDVVACKEQPQWKAAAKRGAEGRVRARAPAGDGLLPRAPQRRRDAGRGWRGRVRPPRGPQP